MHRVNQLALASIGAFAAGLVAGALRLTADYVATREQFGKPLSTFQTVAAQLAEVYIASRTIALASTSVDLAAVRGPRRRRRPRRARLLADIAGATGDADSAITCTAGWVWTSPTRWTATTPRSRT